MFNVFRLDQQKKKIKMVTTLDCGKWKIVDMIRKGQKVFKKKKKRTIFQVKNHNAIGNKWECLNIYIKTKT